MPKLKGSLHWGDKGGYYTARTYYAHRDRVAGEKGKGFYYDVAMSSARTLLFACS